MLFDLSNTPPEAGFPDPSLAEQEPNGLLALGGDLSTERLLKAYSQGLFPWYSQGQPILWWSPDPRMVVYPGTLHVSRSLRKHLRREPLVVRFNTAFDSVIRACARSRRPGEGTWLTADMVAAYQALHTQGYAHSVEVWRGDELVGGLYGLAMNGLFFGESMFSNETNASKTAMVALDRVCTEHDFDMIDCQVHTEHLASLGAVEIPRTRFQRHLDRAFEARERAAWQAPAGDLAACALLSPPGGP